MFKYFLGCLLILVIIPSLVEANPQTYTVIYNNNSPIKNVPLKKSNLIIKMFLSGNPQGQIVVVTDENANFSLPNTYQVPVAIRLVSIKNEENYNAKCCGIATPGSSQLLVTCAKIKGIAGSPCDH